MAVYNHTGQVVTDLERSKRFYVELLGFALWHELAVPDEACAKLLQLEPPLGCRTAYLTLDGFVLELIQYTAAGATTDPRRRSMAEPGLTHISLSVDDPRGVADRAAELGGEVVEDSDIGAALFIRDPDGQLLELLPSAYREHLPPRPLPAQR